MTGRKQDEIWKYFEKQVIPDRKGSRAICKQCHKSMEGQISRLKAHYNKCFPSVPCKILLAEWFYFNF